MSSADPNPDHILLLQTSLNHYEYILSHCQPAYLSHLSVSFSFARGGVDRGILALSTVTISMLPMQFVIGKSPALFLGETAFCSTRHPSQNIKLPSASHRVALGVIQGKKCIDETLTPIRSKLS